MEKDTNKKHIKFDTSVQILKYEVLKRVAENAFNNTLDKNILSIAKEVVDDLNPNVRCCIYKERAIVQERIKVALGGDKLNDNVIEVIDIACDECSINRFIVTNACRGCLAKKCQESCRFGAISFDSKKSKIDYSKCKECGKCKEACPYDAIAEVRRPCMKSCYPKALSYNTESKKAVIDNNKCIQCGACVINCPFGAIMDKSSIVDVINLIKDNSKKVYAIIAPAIASQFKGNHINKVITAIKTLGFDDVLEVALGADLVALHEFNEFANYGEESFLTSSCCPSFVSFIEKKFPMLKDNISNTVSPMIAIARLIKKNDENSNIVFIGPCIAKKMEILREEIKGEVNYVMTFEELLAMLDAKDICIDKCVDGMSENGSLYGRMFARSGGVLEAIKHVVNEYGQDIYFNPQSANGIKECDAKLMQAKFKRIKCNFLEGMICTGGCINGPGTLNHDIKNNKEVDIYGKESDYQNIKDSTEKYNDLMLDLKKYKDR